MSSFYTLLNQIYQRPGMYLGSPSLSKLQMFLHGYWYAREEQEIPFSLEEKEFNGFQDWIQQRFNITTTASWAKIILLHATDERDAFELFYRLWAEFLSQKDSEKVNSSMDKAKREIIKDIVSYVNDTSVDFSPTGKKRKN